MVRRLTTTGRREERRPPGWARKAKKGLARIITSILGLPSGMRIGVYEATAQIGEGGIGHLERSAQ
jgi:hypothetical protein